MFVLSLFFFLHEKNLQATKEETIILEKLGLSKKSKIYLITE